jgi:exodeoxyribonuclease VII small subunit
MSQAEGQGRSSAPVDGAAPALPGAPPAGPAADGAADPTSFEEASRRLSQIVAELEGGDLSLERSLLLFEEGVRLARTAQERLDRAERRVEELLGIDARGKPVVRAFASSADGVEPFRDGAASGPKPRAPAEPSRPPRQAG